MLLYDFYWSLTIHPYMHNQPFLTPPLKGYLIWALAALFYAYEFVLRVSPSVIVDNLILEFSAFELSKATLGSLSALYFYAYALSQIPAGILCDHFKTGRLLTFACLLTTVGTFLFSSAQTIHLANMSRIMIGIGSAFAFVSCLKLARNWIPPAQFPIIVGLTNAFGMLGAILGNQPLAQLVGYLGWREAFYTLGFIGLGLSFSLWLFIPNMANPLTIKNQVSIRSILNDVIHTLTHKQTWLIALYGCLLVAPIATFGELWGVSFFQIRFMISKTAASGLIAWIFIGIGIGGPLIGVFASRISRYKTIMFISTSLALTALLLILYYPILSLFQTRSLLFFYGLFTSNMLLCFSLIALRYSQSSNIAAIGFANMMIMAGGAAFLPLVGKLLDLSREAHHENMSSVLPNIVDFRLALFVLPLCLIIALGLILFIKPRPTDIV